MQPVTVATFNSRALAAPLRERLCQAGLDAVICGEAKIQTFWMPHARAHIKVRVPEAQLAEAMKLIAKWDDLEGILRDAVCCPQCHSSRVQFPQYTRKFLLPSIIALIFSRFRRRYYCQDCHCTWPREGFSIFRPAMARS